MLPLLCALSLVLLILIEMGSIQERPGDLSVEINRMLGGFLHVNFIQPRNEAIKVGRQKAQQPDSVNDNLI
jgi:hypothetical protein